MSRIYLQQVLNRSDAFRATPARKVRICAACGDPGESDPFRAAYPAEHMEALADHFGDEVCLECAGTFAACDRCHDVSDDVRSTTWGTRECPACEEKALAGRAF